ncbi:MAG: precorrin-6y C5,15-methyltransferase (decarboxylating) subunit CbiE [Pseudomonadota bacterium]
MAPEPWLTIVGVGEDGPRGLAPASRDVLARAELVFGAPRHLALFPELAAETVPWPVPFADGIPQLLAARGRRTAMLASGDPFWCGAGSTLARRLEAGEWRALPGPSSFSLAAARLGWPLERTLCLGLHAAPLTRLRPHLVPGRRAILLLRDGPAVAALAVWLTETGFGASALTVLEALAGPRERIRRTTAAAYALEPVHPVAVALEVAGSGATLHAAAGQADDAFEHDGQITKRPVRAITLSSLAPRAGERLWDIGAGSGSVAIEWLLAAADTEATAIEADPARAARIRRNADALGADRLAILEGRAPETLPDAPPDAVFIGGGLGEALLTALWDRLPAGTRLVANAVTLESEALLTRWQAAAGGTLLRIALSEAAPLGPHRGWRSAYPVTQWSVTR